MSSKRRVRELYYHKGKNGKYIIDMVDSSGKFLKNEAVNLSEKEKNSFIKDLYKDQNHKVSISSLGLEVYNRKPEQRMLTKDSNTIFDIYVKNLQNKKEEVKESSYYRHKVAKLLRNVSDILDGDAPSDCGRADGVDAGIEDIELSSVTVMPDYDADYEEKEPSVIPGSPTSNDVPLSMVERVQDCLDVSIDLHDLTFWFQDQKWCLTVEGYEPIDLPQMKRPGTAHAVQGAIQYMNTLLGVNAEIAYDEKNPHAFRFVSEGIPYRICYIYTGDHNVKRRDVNLNMTEDDTEE